MSRTQFTESLKTLILALLIHDKARIFLIVDIRTLFSFYWLDRMRSLRQGVQIWNFEEKKNNKKNHEKSFGCVLNPPTVIFRKVEKK